MQPRTIVDAHVHFWDPDLLDYPWLDSYPTLQRLWGVADYQEATDGIPVEKMVFVECNCDARQNRREAAWIEELAQADPRILAIVAYADLLDSDGLEANLAALARRPIVRGIRHNIQGNPAGFCLQPQFVAGVQRVAELGFHFEICCTHDQMSDVLALVEQCPDARLVLDHCGKPGIKAGLVEPWRTEVERLAEYPNVVCKISALLTEADWDSWTQEQIQPYCDHVAACFGAERIIYGGDWPMVTLAGTYKDWYAFTQFLTRDWPREEQELYYRRNAERFYNI